jgi:hypothetical protein
MAVGNEMGDGIEIAELSDNIPIEAERNVIRAYFIGKGIIEIAEDKRRNCRPVQSE